MPSTFMFYRVQNAAGTYNVEITLCLLSSEVARVSVTKQGKTLSLQTPTKRKNELYGNEEMYQIDNITIGSMITIEVCDKDVVPIQSMIYTASKDGFDCQPQSFSLKGYTWDPKEIELQKIALIDYGYQKPITQQEEIVVPTSVPQVDISSPDLVTQQNLIPLSLAIHQVIKRNYQYVSAVDIDTIARQFSLADGTVDMEKFGEAVKRANTQAKKRAKKARKAV